MVRNDSDWASYSAVLYEPACLLFLRLERMSTYVYLPWAYLINQQYLYLYIIQKWLCQKLSEMQIGARAETRVKPLI